MKVINSICVTNRHQRKLRPREIDIDDARPHIVCSDSYMSALEMARNRQRALDRHETTMLI